MDLTGLAAASTRVGRRCKNVFSGPSSASLGSMDALDRTSPTRSFLLTSVLAPHDDTLRPTTLPAERVCPENPTQFLKLLPCPSHASIAALLESHRIFNADWHGLGVHVRWRADAGVQLRLTVQSALHPVRTWTDRGWYVMVFKPGAN
ncbi:Gpi16 subunit, GPI transamidase component-domain-containing protein [Lactarius quietus]|nr:Gpi16 subunit, GPI transamidase component-domain-containing protein [Lactarius quietus]